MRRIAIVEDNPDNLMLAEAILGSLYEIVSYENGIDALAGLPDAKVELVLLDISLPRMDGVAVLESMRLDDNLKHLPVIALTAHAMVGDREKYMGKGFDEYFTKPIVDFNALIEMVARLIDTVH
ncbi:MAG: response regulator [FCB group bacterium]|nr:response regulator [FCB group bacterium]MBL7120959.1 response regulator [Candidatus Neomarinimicrobiota bacterium]